MELSGFSESEGNEVKTKEMFSKRLTRTDMSKILALPIKRLSLFPPFDGGNEIELATQPVFSRGRLDFVVAKGLTVGDKVTLCKKEDTAELFGRVLCQSRYSVKADRTAEASIGTGTRAAAGASETTLEHKNVLRASEDISTVDAGVGEIAAVNSI
ncbi:Uncharacterized protein TCM_016918 [Theobroma cacao]|uniref:Uncharacterized protein n=1 Tax=Theobroma cacao TaxID=3641 RepID=A0A061EBY8_THECC|nr:Uncharacterized protein TCM_016918 [Theobroma cacao]